MINSEEKEWVTGVVKQMLNLTAACVMALALCTASDARADDAAQRENDAMYCKFFVDGIIGDVHHVEEVTGVPGYYLFSGNGTWDYYIFYWKFREAGVLLEFYPNGGRLAAMKGAIGFEPQVNYWDCASASVESAPDA